MKKAVLYAMILFVTASGLGQDFTQNKDKILAVRVISSRAELSRGEATPIVLEITVEEPYHINSNSPLDEFVVPTSVVFDESESFEYGKVEFPDPEIRRFNFSENPLDVYEGTINLSTTVLIPSSYPGSRAAVAGTVTYQACDENSCLAPADLFFSQTFPVTGEAAAGSPEAGEKEKEGKEGDAASSAEPEEQELAGGTAQALGDKGLFLTFILVFLGGLALNLTPCVYPLIPITIGYFGGQAEGRRGGIVTHALLYVLGMAGTYSTLGVIASLTGSFFGSALQNPFVLVGIAVILTALALSMFNVYEFRLPGFLTGLAGGSKKGYFGTLFMGLTVGFVAAPCIGPFVLGLLTYVGERGDVFLGFFMFFTLALGLGLPFVFLAVFSGSINRLPKSGSWMVWVRTIFGFILLAMAVYFLGPLFPNELVYSLAMALTFLAGGIYMAWIEPTKMAGRVFPLVRNAAGILFFVLALVFAAGGIRSYVDSRVASAASGTGPAAQMESIRWIVYADEEIEKASAQIKPVFVDFYADWCVPCKEMDRTTFLDSRVVDLSRKMVMLKMDLTKSSDPFVKKVQRQHRVKGVPTYIFLEAGGREIEELRTVGYVEADRFIELMERAIQLSGN